MFLSICYSLFFLSLLARSYLHLSLWPGTRVVALGSRQAAEPFLASHALRNTAHALYFTPTPSVTSTTNTNTAATCSKKGML